MSLRRPIPCSSRNKGSIFGDALRLESLWTSMAISPPRSPSFSTPPTEAAPDPVRLPMDHFALEKTKWMRPVNDVVHIFALEPEELYSCALIWFEVSPEPVLLSNRGRLSRSAVLPRTVFADELVWSPILDADGAEGHAFELRAENERQCVVEAVGGRIVVVQSQYYSPLAVMSGLVSPSTRLVFEEGHREQLERLVSDIQSDPDQVYVPTSEILLGRGLDRLTLSGGTSEARRVWTEIKRTLQSMNTNVVQGISDRNTAEFRDVNVSPDEVRLPNLGMYF